MKNYAATVKLEDLINQKGGFATKDAMELVRKGADIEVRNRRGLTLMEILFVNNNDGRNEKALQELFEIKTNREKAALNKLPKETLLRAIDIYLADCVKLFPKPPHSLKKSESMDDDEKLSEEGITRSTMGW